MKTLQHYFFRQQESKVIDLATQRLVKMYIAKCFKLLEPPATLVFIHECASLIHRQFASDFCVESGLTSTPVSSSEFPSINQSSSNERRSIELTHGQTSRSIEASKIESSKVEASKIEVESFAPVDSTSRDRIKSPCWQNVSRRRPYRDVIADFRTIWIRSLVQVYNTHNLCERYSDVRQEEFKDPPEIPESMRLALSDLGTLLGRKELGLGHLFRPPVCWLSLHSNPVILFFQSLIPYSVIDRKGENRRSHFSHGSHSGCLVEDFVKIEIFS